MWHYSGCEVQGRGHIKKQIPCQDKTKTTYINNTYVISLSDGAGSARLSHYGAACVVDSITDFLSSDFDLLFNNADGRQVKMAIMERILTDVKKEAQNLLCSINDLAATMLAVAIKDEKFIIVHIGDGVIGYLDGTVLKVASAPSNGEHANETYFVTSENALNVLKLFKGNINNISGFVIMSDGTEQSLYNKKSNMLSGAVLKLMQHNVLVDEKTMCFQLENTFKNVIITRTQDDCSIALLSKINETLRPIIKLSYVEKCELYSIRNNNKNGRKRVARYDMMLQILQTKHHYTALAKKIRLKPRYTKRHLEHLLSIGVIKCKNGFYYV